MSIDTVVLDVDGTLVDSVYARTIAWKAAFREVGLEVPEPPHPPRHRHG